MSNNRFIFRAWNKKEQRMYSPGEVDNMNLFDLITDEDTWDVMQFTGVCDKAGKLIFEKDIVKYKIPTSPTESKEIVFFGCYTGQFVKGGMAMASYSKKTQVIGNFYENPEIVTTIMKEQLAGVEK